jgi:hypothetical protein
VDIRVAGPDVNAVLGLLVSGGAEAVACTPATLDDLFLRHYKVAARWSLLRLPARRYAACTRTP